MISAWYSHIQDQEERERFKASVSSCKTVFDRMKTILESKEQDILRQENDYNSPNWDYRQADANGYRRCLSDISKLINLDHKD